MSDEDYDYDYDYNYNDNDSDKENEEKKYIDGSKTPRPDYLNMDDFCEDVKNEISLLANLKSIIKEKKRKLHQSKCVLELKYNKYKKCHNFWSIGTIVLSSVLTLIESSKLIFIDDIDNKDSTMNDFFVFSPIILGTIITCTTSLVKFKKYQEQMEEIYIVIDRCICMTSRLKSKKDEINILIETEKKFKINHNSSNTICGKKSLCRDIEDFQKKVKTICDSFSNDIIQEYSSVFIETERYINYLDYHKYLKIINAVEYRRHILSEDRQHFYDKYDHDIDLDRMEDLKKDAIRGCNRVSRCCC